ncbi:HD-GYP domain-containing protein [Aliidiomarina sp.]|uniref:HD-GYP domain-containing protein n=1 Tax=Aliidiomarina sp. TaxID=1872439 RepID=UPI003A4D43B1
MLQWLQKFEKKRTLPVQPEQVNKDLLASLMIMAWFVEAKDPYTGGHLWRVSRYANLLCRAGGLPEADIARITLGGFLHDLGKVAIPDSILNKRGKLDENEFAIIKTHPEAGGRLLAGHPLRHIVAAAVELHHERPDGGGYPYGLNASMIPIDAAIIGICDAFDAMTSLRSYRSPMPVEKALNIMREECGKQFNQFWCEQFLALAEQNLLNDIMGHSDNGIPLHTCPLCGPTVLQQRDNKPGDLLACSVCYSEMELCTEHGYLTVKPTGNKASAAQLQPKADNLLIKQLIEESIGHIPLEQVIQFSSHKNQ